MRWLLTVRTKVLTDVKQSGRKHLIIIRKLLETTICTICHDYMYVPVMTGCGHNYCYFCISNWLNNTSSTELNCPQCRSSITSMPSLNVTLQQNLDALIEVLDKAEPEVIALLDAKRESLKEYKDDVAGNRLYQKVFENTAVAVVDEDDGVARCSNCHWEVEGSVCPHCQARMRNRVNETEFNSDEYSESELAELEQTLDEYRVRSAELMQDLGSADGHSSDGSLADALNRRFPIRQPRDFLHDDISGSSDSHYDEDKYYPDRRSASRSADADTPSDLEGFIVDDEDPAAHESEGSSTYNGSQPSSPASSFTRHRQRSPHITTRVARDSTDDSIVEVVRDLSTSGGGSSPSVNGSRATDTSRDSDYYENNEVDGFVSGDSLDDTEHKHAVTSSSAEEPARKRRYMVLDSDDD